MNLITLDFETYFDQDYTLSKMTTEEYIRDPRFKVHMLGLKYGSKPASIFNAETDGGNYNYIGASGIACLAHHAQFDGFILSHHDNLRPDFWFDTLSMARLVFPHAKSHSLSALAKMLGLPEKTVPYESFKGVRDLTSDLYNRVAAGCANDVELTYAVFKALLPYVPREELRIIDQTVRLFTEPVLRLDRPRLQSYLVATEQAKEAVLANLGVTKSELQSSNRFAELLAKLGVDAPTKPSPTDPTKSIFAFSKTDDAMKELEDHEDERVQALVGARLGQKSTLGETRARRLIEMSGRGPLCVYLKYWGAHTGRWSGGDSLNWQNFTRGSEIRKSITAPNGYQLVVIDLAQIECRMLNWLAGEENVLEAFRLGRDLYSEGASRFYQRTITKDAKVERHLGKTLELGCGYGMGWAKFQLTCRKGALGGPPIILSDDEARGAVASYRNSHPAVTRLWKAGDRALHWLVYDEPGMPWGPMTIEGKYIRLPSGAALDYSHVSIGSDGEFVAQNRNGPTKIYGAKLVENVVQALSRIVMSQAMLKIAERYKIVLTVHDEVVYLAKDDEATEALNYGLQVMKTTPSWCAGLPLDAEGGYDVRYSK